MGQRRSTYIVTFRARIILAAACALATLIACGVFCVSARAAQSADFYAVLHADGELVFQKGASTQAGDVSFAGDAAGYGDTTPTRAPWFARATDVTSARFDASFADVQIGSLKFWFDGCSNMVTCDLANLDASKSDSMRSMFRGCSSLEEIKGLENLDTSSCTYLGSMFDGCKCLKKLDLSNFDATHVRVLCLMCRGCSSLESINMTGPNWSTPSLRLSVHVFEGCSSLKSLDLSCLDTSKDTSMTHEFDGCTSLEYLNLSSIDTSSMGNLKGMFDGCSNLKTVVLGDKFSFAGNGTERQCSLPEGKWKSLTTGVEYAHDEIPNLTADVYTRVLELADEIVEPVAELSQPVSETVADNTTSAPSSKTTTLVLNAKVVTVGLVGKTARRADLDIKAVREMTLGKKVRTIKKGAFKNCPKLKVLRVKTKKLTKKSVKGCLKGSKIKRVEVSAGSKTASKKLAKKYKKLFAKKNSGRKVSVFAAQR